ncbi:MAG: hypothetical protein AMXMBFR13_47970 [Phycisphaerae bacterium]
MVLRFLPEAISFRVLARALSAVQRLVSEEEDQEEQVHENVSRTDLHLLDVKRGSATYPVYAERQEEVLARLKLTGQILAAPERADEVPATLSPVEDLSAIARSLGCEIEFKLPGKDSQVLARITPVSYESIVGTVFVSGDTTIAGRVERVGGATELHCGLRVHQQPERMLICRVESTEVARELGQHLYENVVVDGTATWYRRNWRLRSFSIRSVHQVKRRSLVDGIRALRAAGGSAWDSIEDPKQFLHEVRGE